MLLSSLLTPVYVAAPLVGAGALVTFGVIERPPILALAVGAVVCVVMAVRLLPLTWVRAGADRLRVRGIRRSFDVPFGNVVGIEVSRFGGGLSLMREVTVHYVAAAGKVDELRFVGHIGFGDDAAAARLASAIETWRARGASSRG
jgi:hypothetical protein